MERLIERCAGLDVHRDTVATCLHVPGPNGKRHQEVRTFGTTVAELLAWRDWLEAHRVTEVAMESTGVYWKPVFYVLEDAFTCLLVNSAHIKQVPGRNTDDGQDCVWIAQCLEQGLLRGSSVPPAPLRELRDLTRHRKVLSWPRSPPISSGGRAGLCSRRRCTARRIPKCWPTWPAANCVRS